MFILLFEVRNRFSIILAVRPYRAPTLLMLPMTDGLFSVRLRVCLHSQICYAMGRPPYYGV